LIELLDIGDRVEIGSYTLHSRFREALAFARQGSPGLACVVDARKGSGPIHIVVRGLDFNRTGHLEVAPRQIVLGEAVLAIHRRYDSRVRVTACEPAALDRRLGIFREALVAVAPPRSMAFLLDENTGPGSPSAFERACASRLRHGIERLIVGDLEGGATALKGVGFGLTPSGDDFLAGFLLALYALESAGLGSFTDERQAIRRAAPSDNPFSAALLACAAEGRAIEPAGSLIRALFEGPDGAVAEHTARLAAVGASSGADLGAGLCLGLDTCSRQEVAAW